MSLLDPALGLVAHDLRPQARAAVDAGLPDGPFRGVPFLVKDLSLAMAGCPAENGSRLTAGHVATRDHNLMARFRTAGLVTLGRTRTAEFGAQLSCETLLCGITRNPWSLDHTPGGSSGGSAAAVAAGVVPLAHANDGIGSIRIPASNCGLFGLKLTRQRTPSGPDFGETTGGRGSEFVVTRSVRDAAALLDWVHGADEGAPCWAPPPRRPYVDELAPNALNSRRLRIGVLTQAYSGAAIDAECERAVSEAARLCQALGHVVEPVRTWFDWDMYSWAIRTEALSNFAYGMDQLAAMMGRRIGPDTLEPLNLMAYEEGRRRPLPDYLTSIAHYGTLQRVTGALFGTIDVLLTPTLARPPARVGELGAAPNDFEAYWAQFAGDDYSPFTGIFNVTGHPAVSLPLHWTPDGLPIGVQAVSAFGDESGLLALSAQLEAASPWSTRRPPVHVSLRRAAQ